MGAGLMLAALCDEILIADHTWVSLPEVKFDMPTPIGAAIVPSQASVTLLHVAVAVTGPGSTVRVTWSVEAET